MRRKESRFGRREFFLGGAVAGCGMGGHTTPIASSPGRDFLAYAFFNAAGSMALSEVRSRGEADIFFRLIDLGRQEDVTVSLAGCSSPNLPFYPLWSDGDLLLAPCGDRVSLHSFSTRDEGISALSDSITQWLLDAGGLLSEPLQLVRNCTQNVNLIAARNGSVLIWSDDCREIGQAVQIDRVVAPVTGRRILLVRFWPFISGDATGKLLALVEDEEGRRVISSDPESSGPVLYDSDVEERGLRGPNAPVIEGVYFGPTMPRTEREVSILGMRREDGGWRVKTLIESLPTSEWRLLGKDLEAFVLLNKQRKELVRAVSTARELDVIESIPLPNRIAEALAQPAPVPCTPFGRAVMLPNDNASVVEVFRY